MVTSVAALQEMAGGWKAEGRSLALVPTMGALHEGHLSLVRAAREAVGPEGRVTVSIFVNPTQFSSPIDLASYPRTFEADSEKLAALGADALFHPTAEEMYPPESEATWVTASTVAQPLEGAGRPGHFDGVATIVSRLFDAALPDKAFFGQKDAQQVAVVRALARDLEYEVEIVACPTIREADGLAMSSRNVLLAAADRERAVALARALGLAQSAFAAGVRDAEELARRMSGVLWEMGVEVEYASLVDPTTFLPAPTARPGDLAVIAGTLGGVRLIDNAAVDGEELLPFVSTIPDELPERPISQGAS
ncbi:MAG: pantoate--beta-alanine ligase [Chloroflexota bacterium]|nr:pantoate--beta-alanine ligase [Chloroflexota bacterium]